MASGLGFKGLGASWQHPVGHCVGRVQMVRVQWLLVLLLTMTATTATATKASSASSEAMTTRIRGC